MSAVIVVDESLRQKISQALRVMALAHPSKSIAGEIKSEVWDSVVEKVARRINLASDDFEAGLITATARVKELNSGLFYKRAINPSRITMTAMFGKKRAAT